MNSKRHIRIKNWVHDILSGSDPLSTNQIMIILKDQNKSVATKHSLSQILRRDSRFMKAERVKTQSTSIPSSIGFEHSLTGWHWTQLWTVA